MTAASRRETPIKGIVIPCDPIADDRHIRWTEVWETPPEGHWPGTAHLLDDFCALAHAEPGVIAEFVAAYGVPELRGSLAGSVRVRSLRRQARAIAAARRASSHLVGRRVPDAADWAEMSWADGFTEVVDPDDARDWRLERERFARWLSRVFAKTGVTAEALWLGQRGLAIEPTHGGLLGLIAILLAREVGAVGAYSCDSCGAEVFRARAPRPGERVYCARPECKREQHRRNTAAFRASRRAQGTT